MNIPILAAELARRVPDLAQDCAINRAVAIEAVIRQHVQTATSVGSDRIERARLALCGLGLNPNHFTTIERAVEGVTDLVSLLRRSPSDQPDVQEAVIRKLNLVANTERKETKLV